MFVSNIVRKCHRVGVCPLPDGLKVSAHVLRLEVGPIALDPVFNKFGEAAESEDADVTLTHKVEPQCLDAVI
jgi:hypothetical protein